MKNKPIIYVLIFSVIVLCGIIYISNSFYQSGILHTSVEESNYDAAYRAIKKGAWVNKRKYLLNIAEIASTNPTPLITACKIGDEQIVDLLLLYGADVNKEDNFTGKTPLLAALHGNKANRYALAMHLVESGADIHSSQSTTSALEESVIVLSTDDGYTVSDGYQFFLYLIEHHVEMKICNLNENLLTYAAHYNNVNVVRYLIDNQYFGVNTLDPDGNTALIVASKNDNEIIVKELLNYGADTLMKNAEGKTAIDYAIENSNEAIIAILEDGITKKTD